MMITMSSYRNKEIKIPITIQYHIRSSPFKLILSYYIFSPQARKTAGSSPTVLNVMSLELFSSAFPQPLIHTHPRACPSPAHFRSPVFYFDMRSAGVQSGKRSYFPLRTDARLCHARNSSRICRIAASFNAGRSSPSVSRLTRLSAGERLFSPFSTFLGSPSILIGSSVSVSSI